MNYYNYLIRTNNKKQMNIFFIIKIKNRSFKSYISKLYI